MSDQSDSDDLPEFAYYYTTRERADEVRANGLPPGTIANPRLLTDAEARQLYGFADNDDIVYFRINVRALRDAGFAPPVMLPRREDAEGSV